MASSNALAAARARRRGLRAMPVLGQRTRHVRSGDPGRTAVPSAGAADPRLARRGSVTMARNHCSECGRHGHSARSCAERRISGKEFGLWTAVSPTDVRGDCWLCRCRCGIEKTVGRQELRNGKSLSCGCRQRGAGWQAKFGYPIATSTTKPPGRTSSHEAQRPDQPADVCWVPR